MKSDDKHGQIIVIGKEVGDGDIQHLSQSKECAGVRCVLAALVLIDSRRSYGRIHASLYPQLSLRQARFQSGSPQACRNDRLFFASACHPPIHSCCDSWQLRRRRFACILRVP